MPTTTAWGDIRLVRWPGLRRLQFGDSVFDPQPNPPALYVAAIKHAIGLPRGFDRRVTAMLPYQEISRSVDVQLGYDLTRHVPISVARW